MADHQNDKLPRSVESDDTTTSKEDKASNSESTSQRKCSDDLSSQFSPAILEDIAKATEAKPRPSTSHTSESVEAGNLFGAND